MQHISVALTRKLQTGLDLINALHQHARPLTEDQNGRMKCWSELEQSDVKPWARIKANDSTIVFGLQQH